MLFESYLLSAKNLAMILPLRTFCLVIVSFLSFVAFGFVTPTAASTLSTPPADCSAFEAFLSTVEFTLDYSASLGAECVTISTTLDFGAGQTITEIGDDGTVLDSYAYEITESEGQCALASATENCGAQLIAFNGDNTALTLTADGGTATLTPVAQNTNDWGIWQSYVTLDAGLGNNYRAGGLNPDAVHPSFAGADLGAFASTGSTLSLNGGEIKTYKNNSANVCGGNIQYRNFPIFRDMKSVILFLSCSLAFVGCKPIQEKILGTYDIDVDSGCSNCEENGPELMVFEDADVTDGIPGYYTFEFQNGEAHSGTYNFLHVDTTITVILYPDSASFQYTPILGTMQQTEYRVVGNRIKEKCNGVFRNCVWIRRD